MGPFRIHISKVAERLIFDHLDQKRREILLESIDEERLKREFEIYRILIAPKFLPGKPKNKRWRRRKSYKRADRVLIHVEPAASGMCFWGRFPPSLTIEGKRVFDLEGEALFELRVPGVFLLKLGGRAKFLYRSQKHRVLSTWTHEFAQWAFFAPRIHEDPNFHVEILCTCPKDMSQDERFVRCRVKVADKGRTLDEKKEKIYLS